MTPDHNIFHSCKANFIKNSTEYRVLLSLCSQNQRSIRRAGFVSGWWLFVSWFSQTLCKKLTFFWPTLEFSKTFSKFWNDLPQAMFLHRQHQQEVIGWYPKTTTKVFAPAINYLNVRPFWRKIFWGKTNYNFMMRALLPPSLWCIHCSGNPFWVWPYECFEHPNRVMITNGLTNNKGVCKTLGMVKQASTLYRRHQREMCHPLTVDPQDYGPTWAWENAVPGCRLSCEPLCGELKAEASDQGGKDLTSMLEWSLSKKRDQTCCLTTHCPRARKDSGRLGLFEG